MIVNLHRKTLIHQAVAASAFILAALLFLWATPGQAVQNSAPFTVNINLLTGNPQPGGVPLTGLCRSNSGTSAFGATITYVCSTGATVDIAPGANGTSWMPTNGYAYRYTAIIPKAVEPLDGEDTSPGRAGMTWVPMHDGAYRFVTNASRSGQLFGIVDSIAGIGTITSWRVVNQTELDYLEMMVHW